MNAVEKNKEALTTIKVMNKKGSDKVLVENEVPPETLDYKRLDSQIANLPLRTSRFSKGGSVSKSGR
jgi:hypothetical protein